MVLCNLFLQSTQKSKMAIPFHTRQNINPLKLKVKFYNMDTAHKSTAQNFRHAYHRKYEMRYLSQDTKGKNERRMLHYKIFRGSDE